jgi:hypothetical protein
MYEVRQRSSYAHWQPLSDAFRTAIAKRSTSRSSLTYSRSVRSMSMTCTAIYAQFNTRTEVGLSLLLPVASSTGLHPGLQSRRRCFVRHAWQFSTSCLNHLSPGLTMSQNHIYFVGYGPTRRLEFAKVYLGCCIHRSTNCESSHSHLIQDELEIVDATNPKCRPAEPAASCIRDFSDI